MVKEVETISIILTDPMMTVVVKKKMFVASQLHLLSLA